MPSPSHSTFNFKWFVISAKFGCMSYQLSKQITLYFNNSTSLISEFFKLAHFDAWSLTLIATIGDSCYLFL